MEEFGYRNLIVWQKAKKLVGLVYAEVSPAQLGCDDAIPCVNSLLQWAD